MGYIRTVWFWLLGLEQPGTITAAKEWEWYTVSPVTTTILVLLGAAALIASSLNIFSRVGMPLLTRFSVVVLRLLGFALLLLMLVQLELRLTVQRELPPNVAILTDLSGSMALEDTESGSRLSAARKYRAALLDAIEGDVRVVEYHFDSSLRPALDEPVTTGNRTAIIDSLKELLERERELQAIILLTDANDTDGNRGAGLMPLLAARGLPLYPVVIGRPEPPAVPYIEPETGGEYVRLGDSLHLSATLTAPTFKGKIVTARLFQDGVKEPLIEIANLRIEEKPITINFEIKPTKPGRRIYRIRVEGIKVPAAEQLLVTEWTIDVIDQPIRILYVDIPRDERKILGHWLARDPVFDFAGLLMLPGGGWYAQGKMRHLNAGTGLPDHESDLYEYDIIILGDIPRGYFRAGDSDETKMRWLTEFVKRRGGGLITLGGRSVYSAGGYKDSVLEDILPFTLDDSDEPQIKGKLHVHPTPSGSATRSCSSNAISKRTARLGPKCRMWRVQTDLGRLSRAPTCWPST